MLTKYEFLIPFPSLGGYILKKYVSTEMPKMSLIVIICRLLSH